VDYQEDKQAYKCEKGNIQKLAYVFFRLLEVSVFFKNVRALLRSSNPIQ
jgi:hypothetical protein